MDNSELLTKLHEDLKKLNVNYDAHAIIQNIIATYKAQLAKMDEAKSQKNTPKT